LFASLLFPGVGAVPDDAGPTVIEAGYTLGFAPLLLRDNLFSTQVTISLFHHRFHSFVWVRGLTHVTAGQVPERRVLV
jgi:hypothetical protein